MITQISKPAFALVALGLLSLTACSSGSTEQAAPETGGTYSVNDCGLGAAPVIQETAPDGIAIDGLVIGGTDVPIISVGPDSQPATDLMISDLAPGNGASVAVGDTITVNYCGVGQSTGAMFDSSWVRGEPATFGLNPGGLIEGWVQGVPGMQIGERRLLQIPGDLGYGATGNGGIEPNETLIFVIEIVDINQ